VLHANDDDQYESDDRCREMYRALNAPIPSDFSHRMVVLAELIEPEANWRAAYGATKPADAPMPPSPPELPPASDDDIPF
jgi:hypothetical protein